jgi:hypothetical protein
MIIQVEWYMNSIVLMSVGDIDHFYVLLLKPDPNFVKEILGYNDQVGMPSQKWRADC